MSSRWLTFGKSFIYNKNNKGPRIEPCGTPVVTLNDADLVPLNSTN